MRTQIRLDLRVNNQLTVTFGSWKRKLIDTSSLLGEPQPDKYQLARYRHAIKTSGSVIAESETFENKLDRLFPPLDITKKSQQRSKTNICKLNKPKSFTRFSGQRIRESGAAMSLAANGEMSRCRELTLTLPGNTKEAFSAIAAYSSTAINLLFNVVRKRWGKDALWFFVWEYQKRGALHLHIALHHESPEQCEQMAIALIAQWHNILEIIGEKANTCMFTAKQKDRCTIRAKHQYHTAPIEKDVAAYFSKYAGKEESKNNWYIQKYPVSRFWGSSRSLKQIVRENSLRFDFDYQGNEKEALKKYSELIEQVIEKLRIVSFKQYEFEVKGAPTATLKRYPSSKRVLSLCAGKVFAEGERSIFYIDKNDLEVAKNLLKEFENVF